MQKVIGLAFVGLLGCQSLLADYELSLIDSEGVENKQCIKSYSFSSNLESIAKESVAYKDVYSDQETLTNKLYFGKPVYRKVIQTGAFTSNISIPYNVEDLDEVVNLFYSFKRGGVQTETKRWETNASNLNGTYDTRVSVFSDNFYITYSSSLPPIQKGNITFEYTKTNDEAQNEDNEISSYIHYIPSNSTNDEVITLKLNNVAVKLNKGFTYNSTDDSCTNQ